MKIEYLGQLHGIRKSPFRFKNFLFIFKINNYICLCFFQQALINMGIFDRKSITKTIKTTEGFYFGKSESEGESSYKKSSNTLFDDYLDILPKIGDGCFIITGRKGSGKSAIAKYIKDNATFEDSMFCEIVKSDAINLEKQIQQSSVESETKLVSFFQWLILVKLVKLILEAKKRGLYSGVKSYS